MLVVFIKLTILLFGYSPRPQFVTCSTISNFRSIMHEIFVTSGYDKRIRPANMTETVSLDVNLYFDGILHLSEVDQKMTSVGYFYITWTDPGLTWSASSYGDIENIYIPQNDIWKPDIVLQNGFKTFKEMGEDFNFVQVNKSGEVGWVPSQVFESRCSIDITFFPFDKQTCVLEFEIWSFQSKDVRINSSDGIAYGDYFQEHSSWKVLDLNYKIDNENFYESRVSFNIVIQRKPMYYVTNILLPVILLGSLIVVVFAIPAESGEKISYSITVLLAMSVFLSIISTILPKNSDDACILAIYLLLNVFLGVFAVIFATWQVHLLSRLDTIPSTGLYARVIKCCKRNRRIKPSTGQPRKPADENNIECEFIQTTWKDVARSLDVIFFWTFLIVFVVTTLVIVGTLIIYYSYS